MDDGACQAYLRDFVTWLRDRAEEASAESARAAGDDFTGGRGLTFVEVLVFLQSQSDVFLISREDVGLDGFDAYALLARK